MTNKEPNFDGQRLHALLGEGKTPCAAAKIMGISKPAALRWARRWGFTINPQKRPTITNVRRLKSLLAHGVNPKSAAIQIGVSPPTAYKWAKKKGYKTNPNLTRKAPRAARIDLETFNSLLAQGNNPNRIAKIMGINQKTAYLRAAQAGWKNNHISNPHKSNM